MGRLSRLITLATTLLLCAASTSRALETDQFTVPDRPLPDIGPDLDLKVDLALRMLMLEANSHLSNDGHLPPRYRSNDFFARGIADLYTAGIPECTIESWIRHASLPDKPNARFDVGIMKSVYGKALIGRPITLFTLAPTINLYGHYVGTDKVGHFFQQGWDYYGVYAEARQHGKSDEQAVAAAVHKGIRQENGIYGMFIVNVYSNADLASDLAGLMFYRNLTERVTLPDGTMLDPMLVTRPDGRWELNAVAGDAHCKPFVSDHWDESMNPCLYAPLLKHIVAENLKEIGGRWVAFHHATRDAEERRLAEMRTWHGIHYGHSGYKDVITIVNGYFGTDRGPVMASQR